MRMPVSFFTDLTWISSDVMPIESAPLIVKYSLAHGRNDIPQSDRGRLFREPDVLTPDISIWFLRRERVYTNLKYSRTPAYDIVSGGVAALFAGLLGFLICEKFGFELLDSGDWYILITYIILLALIMRTVFLLCSAPKSLSHLSHAIVNFWYFFLRIRDNVLR